MTDFNEFLNSIPNLEIFSNSYQNMTIFFGSICYNELEKTNGGRQMEIKIYIDVLLLMNTVFDYLLLWVTGFLLKRRVETLRLLMVSFFGGLYAVCVFFLPDFMYHLPCKLFVGALLVILAFKPKSFRLCVQYISVFLTAVFLLGGVAFFALFYTRLGSCFGAAYRNGSFYINI